MTYLIYPVLCNGDTRYIAQQKDPSGKVLVSCSFETALAAQKCLKKWIKNK